MGKGASLRGSWERSALMFLPQPRERGREEGKKSPRARDCRKQIIRISGASLSQETCTRVDLTRNLCTAVFSPPRTRPFTPFDRLPAACVSAREGNMLMALRESGAAFFSSSQRLGLGLLVGCVAAEDNHYHICRIPLRSSRRLFGLSALRVGTKCKAAARLVGGQREEERRESSGGIGRLCLFIDIYLLAFTRLITL